MSIKMSRLIAVSTIAAAALLATGMAASAQSDDYGPHARRVHQVHHVRHTRYVDQAEGYRPLTVNHARERQAYVPYGAATAPGYNPYAGSAAVVTAPIAFGATLASLPFRAINSVFPYEGNTPLVVVGAPVHFAGQIVQAPFAIAQAPFGGPGPFSGTAY